MSTYEYSSDRDLRDLHRERIGINRELGHLFKDRLVRAGVSVGSEGEHHVLKIPLSEPDYSEIDRIAEAFSYLTDTIAESYGTIYNLKMKIYQHFRDGYVEVEFDTMDFHKLPKE